MNCGHHLRLSPCPYITFTALDKSFDPDRNSFRQNAFNLRSDALTELQRPVHCAAAIMARKAGSSSPKWENLKRFVSKVT